MERTRPLQVEKVGRTLPILPSLIFHFPVFLLSDPQLKTRGGKAFHRPRTPAPEHRRTYCTQKTQPRAH